jgi:hypothetical protein
VRSRLTPLTRGLAAVAAVLIVLVTAPPSFAAPTLTISQTQGLSDGQSVTISAGGYQANLGDIAIGQCVQGYTGPADCNTVGGAVFKDADGSGRIASFSIIVKQVFNGHDCTKVQCVIAGSPLPTTSDAKTISANTYVAKISFGSAATAAPSVAATTAATTTAPDDSGTGSLPKTGAGDSVPVLLLGASALLAAGIGMMLLVPGRRRGEHA